MPNSVELQDIEVQSWDVDLFFLCFFVFWVLNVPVTTGSPNLQGASGSALLKLPFCVGSK